MVAYHDDEWGVPTHDDAALFELLTLEGAQAGLSWRTILGKRAGYRSAFAEFDPARVATYTADDIERLLADPSIVRHRGKIESTVENARRILEVQAEQGSFDTLVWSFVDGRPIVGDWRALEDLPATTDESQGAEQGAQAARLPLRRPDHDVRVHAGGRAGRRPRRRMLPPPARRVRS